MAKKNKATPIIHVKKPKIGKQYWFKFAGAWYYGTLANANEKLTETYGVNWYIFEKMESLSKSTGQRLYRYPVSIFNIRENQEDLD